MRCAKYSMRTREKMAMNGAVHMIEFDMTT